MPWGISDGRRFGGKVLREGPGLRGSFLWLVLTHYDDGGIIESPQTVGGSKAFGTNMLRFLSCFVKKCLNFLVCEHFGQSIRAKQ
jgi:hypothetical protein